MTYVEPILLEIEISGDELNLATSGNIEIEGWSKPQNWVINRLISDNFDKIDNSDVSKKITEALSELYSEVDAIDPDISQRLSSKVTRYIDRSYGPLNMGTVLIDSGVVILTANGGQMFLLGESSDKIERTVETLSSNVEEIADIASDFGLSIDIIRGESLAESISDRLGAELLERKQFDNDFELDIYNDIKQNVTSCLDDNVVLRFGEDDPETFEYDILIQISEDFRIVVEVKDASHENANLGKSKLIDTPRDKSDIINTQGNSSNRFGAHSTECFVIVRDMNSQKLSQHRRQANRRNINLVEYDDKGNYLEEIENSMRMLIGGISNL